MKNVTEPTISEFNAQLEQWLTSQEIDKSNLLSAQCYNISIGRENTCIEGNSSMGQYVIEYINRDIAKNVATQSEPQYYDILKVPIIAILVGTSFIYGGLSISLVVSSTLCIGDYYYSRNISGCIISALLTIGTITIYNNYQEINGLTQDNNVLGEFINDFGGVIDQYIEAEETQIKSQEFSSWLQAELSKNDIHVHDLIDVLNAEGFASFIDDVTKYYYGTDKGLGELIDTYIGDL